MKLSIIVPVYNEDKTIGKVLESLATLQIPQVKKEIIVVDDASTDKTLQEIKKFVKQYKYIHSFSHKKNAGKGASVRTGILHATGNYIIVQDADLEYSPRDIPRLVHELGRGSSIAVYGTRLNRFPHIYKEENKPLFILHFFGNRFLSFFLSCLYGQWITDIETCYKLFPSVALKHITIHSSGFEFEVEITAKLIKNGFRIKEIPIVTKPRGYHEGKKLRTFPDGLQALWTILKYRWMDSL